MQLCCVCVVRVGDICLICMLMTSWSTATQRHYLCILLFICHVDDIIYFCLKKGVIMLWKVRNQNTLYCMNGFFLTLFLIPKDGSIFQESSENLVHSIKLIYFGTSFDHQDHNYIVWTRHFSAPEVILGINNSFLPFSLKWQYTLVSSVLRPHCFFLFSAIFSVGLWCVGCILVELCSVSSL